MQQVDGIGNAAGRLESGYRRADGLVAFGHHDLKTPPLHCEVHGQPLGLNDHRGQCHLSNWPGVQLPRVADHDPARPERCEIQVIGTGLLRVHPPQRWKHGQQTWMRSSTSARPSTIPSLAVTVSRTQLTPSLRLTLRVIDSSRAE